MPTIRNKITNEIFLTDKFMTDTNYEVLSDEPLYRPMLTLPQSFSDKTDVKHIEIDYSTINFITITNIVSCTVSIRFHSETDSLICNLIPGTEITFEVEDRIKDLYLEPNAAGSCDVILKKE